MRHSGPTNSPPPTGVSTGDEDHGAPSGHHPADPADSADPAGPADRQGHGVASPDGPVPHTTSGGPAQRSDAALTQDLRASDPFTGQAALDELYRRHHPAVLAYARTCCRDPHTAEDLGSEAFTRTLQAVRAGGGPTEAWRPYLLTAVRRTAAAWSETARRTELAPDFDRWLSETPTEARTPHGTGGATAAATASATAATGVTTAANVAAGTAAAGKTAGASGAASTTAGVKIGAGVGASLLALAVGGFVFFPDGEDEPRAAAPRHPPATHAPPTGTRSTPTPAKSSPPPSPSRTQAVRKPSRPAAQPADARTRLRIASTGRCMDISDAPGSAPHEAPCTGAASQQWDLLLNKPAQEAQLRNRASGLCLVHTGTETDGAPVHQQSCASQNRTARWTYFPQDDGTMAFAQQGSRLHFLGLDAWHDAAQGRTHPSTIGTTANYYNTPSLRFRYDGDPLDR
ncbi:hypothetical protein DTL70_25745 [Streptomyces diacarni]|uniref:Uncharacterized protein n=1 Tax=Streptomyces diacarni TaxID=2800381 RepID=A0A367EMT6_9ACTN|nr:RICIN domain-containing protein [Streptomyces diacarni]RCG19002.1 hypothetical protein DTL70_25745 [Streptomyces diacarni]